MSYSQVGGIWSNQFPSFLVFALGEGLEYPEPFFSILIVPWLQAKAGHEHGPASVGLDDCPFGGGEGRLCESQKTEAV